MRFPLKPSTSELPGNLLEKNTSAGRREALPNSYSDLIRTSAQGSIFMHRWWLEAVAPQSVEILELRSNQGLMAAWPLVKRDTDAGLYVVMPALTQKLGILFARTVLSPVEAQSENQKLAAQLIDRLPPRMVGFHQNFHENFTDWLPFYWNGYTQTTRYTYVLEDISDPGRIWNEMRPNHRRDIRRTQKLGIRVHDGLDISKFIDLNRKTFTRQGRQPLASDELIYRLDAACGENAGRKIFAGVDQHGRVHAAIYVAWSDGTAYYLMGGSEPEYRSSGAQLLCIWDAIRFASSVARRFDFEGSMIPQIERVFRGFGARQVPYFSISKVPPPPSNMREYLRAWVGFRIRCIRNAVQAKYCRQDAARQDVDR